MLSDKPFLETYTGQSTDELIELGEVYRLDSIVLAFESAIENKLDRLGTGALSQTELDVLAVEAMEREVNNGGYDQFFSNSSHEFKSILPGALQRIGCPKTFTITEEALRIWASADAAALEDLDDCDKRYYETGEDIAGQLFQYIVRNRRAIDLNAQ